MVVRLRWRRLDRIVTDPEPTYRVGPGRTYTQLSQVVNLLQPGDIVEVDGNATYNAVQFSAPGTAVNPITIRGSYINGNRPVISGGSNTIHTSSPIDYYDPDEGAHFYILKNLVVTGATQRGIYHQANDLTLINVWVHGCPNDGILGGDYGAGNLTLRFCEISDCGNNNGDGFVRHPLYMGGDELLHPTHVLRVEHSWIHDSNGGNNIKSRAARNEIYYNRIESAFYHSIECVGTQSDATEGAVREDSDIVGNLIVVTNDWNVVRFGGDGTAQTWGRYRFVNNTVIAMSDGIFRLYDGIQSLAVHNNVFHRLAAGGCNMKQSEEVWSNGVQIAGTNNWIKTGSTNIPAQFTGTLSGSAPGFTNAGGGDFSVAVGSPLIGAANESPSGPAGYECPNPLFPPAYQPPGTPNPYTLADQMAWSRPVNGVLDIGAYERS